MMDDLFKLIAEIEAAPPVASGLWCHHSVPWGKVFRQWDTDGRLWLWVNQGEIEDLPRGRAEPSPLGASISPWLGIPVYRA